MHVVNFDQKAYAQIALYILRSVVLYNNSIGRPSQGGNDARCVVESFFEGGGSLESLCDVMQRPDGHDQRAYSTGICDNPTETGYFCQMIAPTFKLHMTSTLIVDL